MATGRGGGGSRQERGGSRGGAAGLAPVQHGDRPGLCGDAARLRPRDERALARAEEAAAVCRKHGFTYYLSVAEILAGWAMAMTGDAEAGVARLRHGLEAFKASGAEIRLPFYHGLLAEACALAGQLGEALANISNGFAFQSKNGEVWAAAELHRIHGDLLLQNGNPQQARASYQRSLEAARLDGLAYVRTTGGHPSARAGERRFRRRVERL